MERPRDPVACEQSGESPLQVDLLIILPCYLLTSVTTFALGVSHSMCTRDQLTLWQGGLHFSPTRPASIPASASVADLGSTRMLAEIALDLCAVGIPTVLLQGLVMVLWNATLLQEYLQRKRGVSYLVRRPSPSLHLITSS